MASSPASIEWHTVREPPQPAPRCVSLPFTGPALGSMRVRCARQGGLEMLLGNPGGGRGIYIARWAALRDYAAPSLHDILLAERLAAGLARGEAPCPAAVQAAAISVAATGHAGRRVAQAAQSAPAAAPRGRRPQRAPHRRGHARARGRAGSRSALNDPWSTRPQEDGGWLAAAPALLARHLPRSATRLQDASWQPGEIASTMATIATLAWPIGAGPWAERARLPRVLQLLRAPSREPASLQEAKLDRLVQAETALRHARALLADPLALLSAWREDEAGTRHLLEQPHWLLDGWDRLCLLEGDSGATTALLQMLLYDADSDRTLKQAELGPAGTLALYAAATGFDMLLRNEGLRRRELQLHDPEASDV